MTPWRVSLYLTCLLGGLGWRADGRGWIRIFTWIASTRAATDSHVSASRNPLVSRVMTMLWTCGCGRPCGPQWCSKEAMIQRCGLTGENVVMPAFAAVRAPRSSPPRPVTRSPAPDAIAARPTRRSQHGRPASRPGRPGRVRRRVLRELPNKVSDLAVGSQAAQHHVVDVASERQLVIAACRLVRVKRLAVMFAGGAVMS
jgi:hypothetical protein